MTERMGECVRDSLLFAAAESFGKFWPKRQDLRRFELAVTCEVLRFLGHGVPYTLSSDSHLRSLRRWPLLW